MSWFRVLCRVIESFVTWHYSTGKLHFNCSLHRFSISSTFFLAFHLFYNANPLACASWRAEWFKANSASLYHDDDLPPRGTSLALLYIHCERSAKAVAVVTQTFPNSLASGTKRGDRGQSLLLPHPESHYYRIQKQLGSTSRVLSILILQCSKWIINYPLAPTYLDTSMIHACHQLVCILVHSVLIHNSWECSSSNARIAKQDQS